MNKREGEIEESRQGVRGWLLLLCIWMTIIWPLFTFAKLHEMPDAWMYCALGIIIFAIVSGVFLWRGNSIGVLLARVFLLAIIALNLISVVTLGRAYPDRITLTLFQTAIPTIWLIYLQLSKRVEATYGQSSYLEGKMNVGSNKFWKWIWTDVAIGSFVVVAIRGCYIETEGANSSTYAYQPPQEMTPIPNTSAVASPPGPALQSESSATVQPVETKATPLPAAAIAPAASPMDDHTRPSPVELPENELGFIKGLSVDDKGGVVNIHNDSAWTITSIEFVIVVSERYVPNTRETFRYKAVSEDDNGGSPYANSRFSFRGFDNDEIVKGLNFVNPVVSWQIVSASGLKP